MILVASDRPFGRAKLDVDSERARIPFTTADFAPNNERAPAAGGLDPARQQGTGHPAIQEWLGRRSITSTAVSRHVTCAPHPSEVAAVRALVRIGHRREPIRWPAIGHMTYPHLRTASPLNCRLVDRLCRETTWTFQHNRVRPPLMCKRRECHGRQLPLVQWLLRRPKGDTPRKPQWGPEPESSS
jgi:hypothetical protein